MTMSVTEQRRRDEQLLPRKPWPARPQKTKILSTRSFKAGYHIDVELFDNLQYMGKPAKKHAQASGRFMILRVARTNDGANYVGDPRWAYYLFVKRRLTKVQPPPDCKVCAIGFNARIKQWYGWSHRAICGFGIGDKLFTERFKGATDKTPFTKHGTVTIANMRQAKLAAIRFARYVS